MSAIDAPGIIAQVTAGTVILARVIVTLIGVLPWAWITVSVTCVPSGPRTSRAISSTLRFSALVPSMAMMRSPDRSPARDAGEPLTTDWMNGTPHCSPR